MTNVRKRVLFAVDREGILCENEEAECPATGAYCTVCNRARAEADEVNRAKDQASGGEKVETLPRKANLQFALLRS
ncbi:hypothetical protein FACS189487_06990 [Campylobacterota bacterium]|nr:hypothetical protein FACS189487_06990 [Campylobacterota bacterium]